MFPALRTHPLGWGSVVWVVMFRLPGKLVSASVPWWPVCGPLAASLLLTHCGGDSMDFFGAGSRCVLNFFHANGLAPSGGHILSSPAKKEYGKKDAAQGGRSRPMNPPLGWVSVVRVVMF